MTDALIAGAGIAGSALAIHLGRRGYSVVLVERNCFPREKPYGEGLMPAGVAVQERLGIDTACPRIPRTLRELRAPKHGAVISSANSRLSLGAEKKSNTEFRIPKLDIEAH